ncbi:MAG: sulfotransferase, partial [Gammaproteobacteria bacterium]
MNRSGRLPGFIVVGAQKAGTTSLHVWLDRLPGVCMPRDKETNFFSDDARFKRGIEWYCSRFNHCDSKAVLGEVSPEYLFSPVAAERIHGMLPDIRLIFIFREPVQRAYSQYLMSCRKGLETLGFCEALIHEEKRLREHPELSSIIGYMKRSRYCEQVRRYLKYFRRNQCLFLKFESLVAGNDQTREVLEAIAEFIGIEAEDLSLPKENPASIPRWPWLQQALYSSPFWKRWIRVIVPAH